MLKQSKFLYPLRVISRLLHLPGYIAHFEARDKHLSSTVESLVDSMDRLTQRHEEVIEKLNTMQQQLIRKQLSAPKPSGDAINHTVSDNHEFDYFYKLFEDRFRGSEEVIRKRITEHLPLFKALPSRLKKLPIVDIGSGRGEFLGLMGENGFDAIGIDMNGEMVSRSKELGFKAELTDAMSYLQKQPDSSLASVTGFHIVEHIPFEDLMRIFAECHRAIAPGGFVLFETPNPETLSVGANTFYLDPSHQRPVPPGLLDFMLSNVGFETKVVYMRRVKPKIKSTAANEAVYDAVFGPADYAVIGTKA